MISGFANANECTIARRVKTKGCPPLHLGNNRCPSGAVTMVVYHIYMEGIVGLADARRSPERRTTQCGERTFLSMQGLVVSRCEVSNPITRRDSSVF
jgi:hypothetical protein